MSDVTIVGGGISGLSTAFFLKQLGIRSTLVEKSVRVGGLIHTDNFEGCELEQGPDSFLASKTAALQLANQLGLKDQIIGTNEKDRRTYIAKNGRLVPIPSGTVMMVPGNWKAALTSPLFTLGMKRRLLAELRFPRTERAADVSVQDFVSEHFGDGVLRYLTEPLLSGVYGGDPARLSAQSVLPKFVAYERQFGSLVRGVRSERTTNSKRKKSLFLSFRGGMSTLINALASNLRDSVENQRGEVLAVRRSGSKWVIVSADKEWESEQVVLAGPAHVSAHLLSNSIPALSSELEAIPYSSAILVTLLFDRSSFTHPLNGFGFLVPRAERKTIAAATWVNTKFPSRIAPDLVAIRTFIVDPQASAKQDCPADVLVQQSLDDLRPLMQLEQGPLYSSVTRWPQSMPQYLVGHHHRVRRIEELEMQSPGLHLTSNYFAGVGIPDCISRAESIAKRIADELHR